MLRSLLYLCVFLLSQCLLAQKTLLTDEKRFPLDPQITYDSKVPSPAQFLGYPLGEEYTIYAHTVNYLKALDQASDRVSYNEYGKTWEGRPLVNLVITSPENQRNIESIRKRHLEIVEKGGDPASLNKNEPLFVSLSYSIHGNEPSTTESAMQVAYRFAAAQDAETEEILKNTVIVIFMCINPDGRDRYIYWYKSVQRNLLATGQRDLDHYEPWPGGRVNHYWFDTNRDWSWGTQPETRTLAAEYQRWMSQVHGDYHEQGYNSNYFTMPGTTPRNKLLPDNYEALTDTFGMANIKEFDKHRISYFTRDAFDFFYPGYGSSYPSVMGAIGMLTEQGGIGGGRAIETDDGYVLTLRQRIFDHYTTSVATIRKAHQRRELFWRYSLDAWNASKSKSPIKAYYLSSKSQYSLDVVNNLLRHNIKVEQAQSDFSVADARDYKTGLTGKKDFPKGTFIVPTNQPRHLFIHTLLDRNLQIEDSVMYDMSSWSAILAYGIDGASSNSKPSVNSSPVAAALKAPNGLSNANATYAYVIDYQQRNAPKALAMLWEKGYRVKAAAEAFAHGNLKFSPGSLIVLLERNEEKMGTAAADLAEVADKAGVNIQGFNTGRMQSGWDLASARNRVIKQPRVAMLIEPPFSSQTAGQIAFLFDQEVGLPVDRIKATVLQQSALPKFGERYGLADLNNYDVLILPDGGAGLGEVFKPEQLAQLRDWVQRGGVVVATESAAAFFTNERSKFTGVKLLSPRADTSLAARTLIYDEREDYFGLKRTPGTALNTVIDHTHPLAFGLDPIVYTLKLDNSALAPHPDMQSVGRYAPADKILASGYISPENQKMLANNTFAGVLQLGQGKLILLPDNTQYRMFWRGPSRMLLNAVMLVRGF